MFLRLWALCSVVIPRVVFAVMFPHCSRERLLRRIDQTADDMEQTAKNARGLLQMVDFEQKTMKKLLPTVFPHFVPRCRSRNGPSGIVDQASFAHVGWKGLGLDDYPWIAP